MSSPFFRFGCLGALLFLSSLLHAQNIPAAKQSLDIQAYGGYTFLSPDYGPYNDHGFLVGGDVGRPFRAVMGSIDARYTYGMGQGVSEWSLLAGPRVDLRHRRFDPYADFLIGYGVIDFTHPASSTYTHDNSVVFALGGGLNYEVWRSFSVKGDLTYQYWKLGSANSYMTPVAISVGVSYRVPLGRPVH
jgi:opacity protein-like surface antigen